MIHLRWWGLESYHVASLVPQFRLIQIMSKNSIHNQTNVDLEIKDALVIFRTVWTHLVEEFGHENLRFPKELILLGGAPGAGKGTQTKFILNARGLTCAPIVVSSLLNTSAAEKAKDNGQMVGDKDVVGIVLRELLKPEYSDGALLDGFPRTRVQVECLKMLVDKINSLHDHYEETSLAIHFRRPTIHAMVLFVGQQTSIDRQLKRGFEVARHNQEVEETGIGVKESVRPTDLSPEKSARRYQVFKEQTWDALQSLKEIYHYHFINAEGPVDEVEANILDELQYQSSLELGQATFDLLSPIPLAEEIIVHARQELVRRLDSYEIEHNELFVQIVKTIQSKFMPIIKRHALSGRTTVNSEDLIFDNPLALSMLIDIFSERGFHAVIDKTIKEIPERFDLKTGEIAYSSRSIYRIHIRFKGSEIRRG